MVESPLKGKELYDYLTGLVTEASNPDSTGLDRMSTNETLELINREDASVATVVKRQIGAIGKAVELVYESLKNGGRLFYVGAGTSGRLGVLDAAECPPTFGIDPGTIVGLIAGGAPTLIRSAEGVEDNEQAGRDDIAAHNVGSADIVCGLTASRRTPYVTAGLKEAKKRGASTIFICCNPIDDRGRLDYDLVINPVVGPEVLSGSTRMKAALAEKMILTMLTTTVMIKLGKVYGNRMVDLQATSEKLKERSKRVLVEILGCNYLQAEKLLMLADGHVKTALVMALRKCDKTTAHKFLKQAGGIVYKAIDSSNLE